MTRRCARDGGFTLLELLVSIAVLGLLLVLLDQGVAFGLRASALQDGRDWMAELPAVDAALRGLVANADPGIYPEPPAFEGGSGSLSLLTALTGPNSARQPVDAMVYAADGQLRLRWTPHRHVDRFSPPPPPEELTLLDGVQTVRLDYYAKSRAGWRSSWRADGLPALVRIQLVFVQAGRHWPALVIAPRREPVEQ